MFFLYFDMDLVEEKLWLCNEMFTISLLEVSR